MDPKQQGRSLSGRKELDMNEGLALLFFQVTDWLVSPPWPSNSLFTGSGHKAIFLPAPALLLPLPSPIHTHTRYCFSV